MQFQILLSHILWRGVPRVDLIEDPEHEQNERAQLMRLLVLLLLLIGPLLMSPDALEHCVQAPRLNSDVCFDAFI